MPIYIILCCTCDHVSDGSFRCDVLFLQGILWPETDKINPQLNHSARRLSHIHKMAPLNGQRVHKFIIKWVQYCCWFHFSTHELDFTVVAWFNEKKKIKVKCILACNFVTYSYWNHLEAQTAPDLHTDILSRCFFTSCGKARWEGDWEMDKRSWTLHCQTSSTVSEDMWRL